MVFASFCSVVAVRCALGWLCSCVYRLSPNDLAHFSVVGMVRAMYAVKIENQRGETMKDVLAEIDWAGVFGVIVLIALIVLW